MKKIYFAGGCFWGVEHFFSLINGVKETTVGYANSNIPNPDYPTVKAHKTTAAETVEVIYDESTISLEELVYLFFKIIDPTLIDKQGEDEGHQYRSGIYYLNDEDLGIINKVLIEIQKQYKDTIVTEVLKLENFYMAEEYHQDYLVKNKDGYCHISPMYFKLAKEYKTKK